MTSVNVNKKIFVFIGGACKSKQWQPGLSGFVFKKMFIQRRAEKVLFPENFHKSCHKLSRIEK